MGSSVSAEGFEPTENVPITVFEDPSIAYDPSNGYLYVTNSGSNNITIHIGMYVIISICTGKSPELESIWYISW